MEKSGFFNALIVDGVADRKYNANDYCDNLAAVINNGVLRSIADDLKVTASGMIATMAAGRAWINGHYYYNDSPKTFSSVTASTNGNRYDAIVLRLDTSVHARSIKAIYVQGTAAESPEKVAPIRNDNIYDLIVADVYVGANATSIKIEDARENQERCGWMYSTSGDNSFFVSLDNQFFEWFKGVKDTLTSVTLFKRYNWRTILSSAANAVSFDVPQYNAETCHIEVFANGILETEGVDYSREDRVLTFTKTKIAGTEIEVKVYKSLDGTGIESVADEITDLQNQVAVLNAEKRYRYVCTGVADNVAISDIAQSFLDGTGDFAGVPEDAQMRLVVYGKCGVTAAHAGDGSSANPYRWFSLGKTSPTTRKITVDFSHCDRFNIPIAGGTTNRIVRGSDVNVVGLRVKARCTALDCSVFVFDHSYGDIVADSCEFDIVTTGEVNLARAGTFINCKAVLSSANGMATAFKMENGAAPIRVFGGEYLCYVGSSASVSSVVYAPAAQDDAVCVMHGVNCPTSAVTSFYQSHALRINSGYLSCFGLISALQLATGSASKSEIVGTIPLSKI